MTTLPNEMKEQIGPIAVHRDPSGWWTHPGFPNFDEGEEAACAAWIEAQGLVTSYSLLEYEDDDHPSYVDYYENSGSDVSEWNPTPPASDGWFALSIHDTEDGPVFVWVRRIEQPKESSNGE